MTRWHLPHRPPRKPQDREDAESTETWNGGDGTVTFNHLQQSEAEPDTEETLPDTTDPWSIVT